MSITCCAGEQNAVFADGSMTKLTSGNFSPLNLDFAIVNFVTMLVTMVTTVTIAGSSLFVIRHSIY